MPVAAQRPRRAASLAAMPLVLVALAAVSACAAGVGDTETAVARGHIQALAGTIGARPHGSPAAGRAREYIVAELRELGFTVRIQEADAIHDQRGLTARVRNIIAWLDGEESAAVALVSHYDSRPGAPGAIDDGVGVAVSLTAARILAAEPRRHSLAVLVTDAEELGLMGARALVQDAEVRRRVGAFINLEGTGGHGPMLLFEATGGPVLGAWTRSDAPEGTSLGNEIYRRLPNDTDFTMLRALGVDGINLAPVGDSYAYHTTLDVPDRVSDATLAHGVATVTSTVRALDDVPLPAEPGNPDTTFFDLAAGIGISYAPWVGWALAIIAAGLAGAAWVSLAIEGRRRVKLTGLLLTGSVAVLVAVGAAAGLAGTAWLLPAARAETMPWYAAPWFYYAFITTGGLAGGWAMARLARTVVAEKRVWRSAAAVWWTVLPLWVVLTIVVQRQAPAVSFMFALPLLAAGLAAILIRSSAWLVRVASLAPLLVSIVLWLGDTARLLSFLAALSGWLPQAPPWWAFASIIGLSGLMLGAPAIALLAGLPALPRAAWGAVATVAPLVVVGSAALALPAYRDQRPQRRTVTYVERVGSASASWIIGGREAAGDLQAPPEGQAFLPVDDNPEPDSPAVLAGVPGPFRYQAAASGTAPVPAVVTASARIGTDGRRDVDLTVLPRQLVTAQFRLPSGAALVEASLAGRRMGDRWVGTYAAVPTAGFTVRFTLGPAPDPDAPYADLAGLDVVLHTSTVPGATQVAPLPAWLPSAASTWATRSVFVVPVTPTPVR